MAGRHPPGHGAGHDPRARSSSDRRDREALALARDDDRPHRLRHGLADGAARRRPGARQRRHASSVELELSRSNGDADPRDRRQRPPRLPQRAPAPPRGGAGARGCRDRDLGRPQVDPALRRGRRRREPPAAGRRAAPGDRRRPTACCSRPRNTTPRSRACSRTRSTGPRGRGRRPRCRASPRPWSAPPPAASAPSGRRPSCARCSARPAPASSTSTCR